MALDDAVRDLLLHDPKLYLPEPGPLVPTPSDGRDDAVVALETPDEISRAISARAHAISYAIHTTAVASRQSISDAVTEVERWIAKEEIVRVAGAGRALLAAAIPANRLAHCGARVYVAHDVTPLPNTIRGGNVLAASASGRTQAVLDLMRTAKERNPDIRIVGIADRHAEEFAALTDIFIGIEQHRNVYANPLQALADTGEYVISELLDAIIVAAAKRLGMSDQDFRKGHEDLLDTGPYRPEDNVRA